MYASQHNLQMNLIQTPKCGHDARRKLTHDSRPMKATVIRYFPTAFFLHSDATGTAVRPFPPQTTRTLMFAMAAGERVVRDEGREFNLLRREMRDLWASPEERFPVPIVLGRPSDLGLMFDPFADGASVGADGVARMRHVISDSAATDGTAPDVLAVMRCMRVLLQLGYVVVGGAVADAVVHNELLKSGFDNKRYTIEAEMPLIVNMKNYVSWIAMLVAELNRQALAASVENVRLEPTEDPLSGVVTPNGRLRVDVDDWLTLLLVPAWNAAQHPKRTLDFSFSNLRLERVVGQSKPRYRLLQSVPIGVPTAALIEATRARRAAPITTVEWRDGKPMPSKNLPLQHQSVIAAQLDRVRLAYALVALLSDGLF